MLALERDASLGLKHNACAVYYRTCYFVAFTRGLRNPESVLDAYATVVLSTV